MSSLLQLHQNILMAQLKLKVKALKHVLTLKIRLNFTHQLNFYSSKYATEKYPPSCIIAQLKALKYSFEVCMYTA